MRARAAVVVLSISMLACAAAVAAPKTSIADDYLERYFRMFPSRATEAGRHDLDHTIEDFSPARREQWIAYNRSTRERVAKLLQKPALPFEERLDYEALLAEINAELHSQNVLRRAEPIRSTGRA